MRLKDKKTNGVLTVKLILTACEGLEDHEVETLYGEPITLKTLNKYCVDAPEEKKYGGRVPKRGDKYWYVSSSAQIVGTTWYSSDCDKGTFECGSAFWTEEEAEKEAKRRKAYMILKEDTKEFAPEWTNGNQPKYLVVYDYYNDMLDVDRVWCWKTNGWGLYFATKEDAEASIKAHPSEWKTWLGAEDE